MTATQQTVIARLDADLSASYATRDALLMRDFAEELREFSPLGADELEALIEAHPGAVIVFADPDLELPESAWPREGVIIDADGEQVTL